MPSRIAFEISIFPNNVPLPAPKTLACLIGATLHFIHFCIRVYQIRSIPDSNIGWEDMYREDNLVTWFDWVATSLILLYVHSVRPLRVPARALRLSADKPAHSHKSRGHIRVGTIPRLLAVPTRHYPQEAARTAARVYRNWRCGRQARENSCSSVCFRPFMYFCGCCGMRGTGSCWLRSWSASAFRFAPSSFSPFPPAWSHPCQICFF
jgi:hypothetical protein